MILLRVEGMNTMDYRKITYVPVIFLCIVFLTYVPLYEIHVRNKAQS